MLNVTITHTPFKNNIHGNASVTAAAKQCRIQESTGTVVTPGWWGPQSKDWVVVDRDSGEGPWRCFQSRAPSWVLPFFWYP